MHHTNSTNNPFALSLSKGTPLQVVPFVVRQANHERAFGKLQENVSCILVQVLNIEGDQLRTATVSFGGVNQIRLICNGSGSIGW